MLMQKCIFKLHGSVIRYKRMVPKINDNPPQSLIIRHFALVSPHKVADACDIGHFKFVE
jgi:hypothetical protein